MIELLPLVTGKENCKLTEAFALGEMAGESQRWFAVFFFPLPRKSCKEELASLSTDTDVLLSVCNLSLLRILQHETFLAFYSGFKTNTLAGNKPGTHHSKDRIKRAILPSADCLPLN